MPSEYEVPFLRSLSDHVELKTELIFYLPGYFTLFISWPHRRPAFINNPAQTRAIEINKGEK